jgi:hypothetical protein
LQAWVRRPTSAQALALRSRIVLACAEDSRQANGQIAGTLGMSRPTVTKWRNRFAADRLASLLDEPRRSGGIHRPGAGIMNVEAVVSAASVGALPWFR